MKIFILASSQTLTKAKAKTWGLASGASRGRSPLVYIYGQYFYFPATFVGQPLRIAPSFGMLYSTKKVSLQKKFSAPFVPPFVCDAYLKVQNNPFFRVFYLFSNAHYSKQNWYFIIQRPPKSWFFGLVFFKNQRDTLFCNLYFSRWFKRNEILGNSSKAGLL